MLNISELFYSIQGESTYAGLPCVFIRLAGCNLRCSYCDARYTYEEEATSMSLEKILDYVSSYPDILVEITGGEPLLQPNTYILIKELINLNRRILIETNGSLDISTLPSEATVIMDIKCPGSNTKESFHRHNIEHCTRRNSLRNGSCEVKFVISDIEDYEWAKDMVLSHELQTNSPVLFSPVKDGITPQLLTELILKDRLSVRLQLQLHTFIWPEIQRGV